ncbi:MAG: RNA polymerase factor sigma-54 [Planctomycetota bacterium]|nr:RNA polymerase factor sigma-54 [Planctomycetota bacterium]
MQLNFSQQMRMSQQMKLAPRMIQSMEILQLPYLALQERIEQELEDNVTLIDGGTMKETSETERDLEIERAREEANEKQTEEKELLVDNDHGNDADFERLVDMANDWPDDNFAAESRPSSNRISDAMDSHSDMISNVVMTPQTLHDYLLEQFHYFGLSADLRAFGEYLIQNLDHNGRLQSSLPEITQVYGGPITYEDATQVLERIQQLDPPGVGARDLKECLLLQLTPELMYHDVLEVLIGDHLDDLGHNRMPLISRKTGYSIDLIKDAMEEMRHLDPFPGRKFEVRLVQNVTPDLEVVQEDDGRWVVKVIDEYVPNLRISRKYIEMLRNGVDATTKEYIKKKIDSAKWLIESIEQRYSTLRKVAQAIVDHQTAFLDNGPEFIHPLKMQQVADQVGVHVTTVSRAVDDKWVQTPRGLFPLKRFFGGGTKTSSGEDVAWGIIRIKLQEIVDGEDKDSPYSDDALVAEMAKLGYELARRTVTKYRKKMNIPSSRQRRQY